MHTLLLALSSLLAAAAAHSGQVPDTPPPRTMSLVYEVTVPPIPAGEGPVDVFVPLAPTDEHQEVLDRRVEATIPGVEGTESRYGNRFWRGHLDASDGEPIKVSVRYVIRRAHRSNTDWSLVSRETYTEEEQARWRPFLDANERVPVDGELVDAPTMAMLAAIAYAGVRQYLAAQPRAGK